PLARLSQSCSSTRDLRSFPTRRSSDLDGGATYGFGQEVFFLNKAATHSAFALAIVQIPFIINFFYSLKWGRKVAENPWDATTARDRKSTRLNSSHVKISYAVFCLKKKR